MRAAAVRSRPVMMLVVAGVLSLLAGCGTTVATVSGAPTGGHAGGSSVAIGVPTVAPASGLVAAPTAGVGAAGNGGDRTRADSRRTAEPAASAPALPAGVSGHSRSPIAVRGPLMVGMVYTSNGAANAALGVATSASSDPKSLMAALVAGLNRQGGVAGRRLTIDYDAVDATSSDYSTQADAACAKFTQDDPVPVVLDFAFGNRYGMASCLAKHGVADFGIGTTDTAGDNAVGLFAAPDWMTSTRRYAAVLTGLHQTGYLTSGNEIGVLLENCAYLQRAYQQSVLPAISRLALHLADTEEFDCTTGFSSAGPASASVQSAVLRFRSHGVDRVLIVSDYEQVALLLLANDAESQGWRPGYMLSSAAQTEVMRSNIPSGQWPQLHGIGWSPGLDTDDPHRALPAADQHCLDLIKAGGLSVSGWQNTYVATSVCSDVFFLGAVLQGSGGDARGSALMAAVDSLGARFVAPGIVGGRTSFGPRRHDGPAAVAPFGYVASCSCLRYTGTTLAVS